MTPAEYQNIIYIERTFSMKKLLVAFLLLLLVIPAHAEETFSDGAFGYTILPDNTACITACYTYSTDIVIPNTLGGVPVTVIGETAFQMCRARTIVIPEGVTTIGSFAFNSSASLQRVSIPNSVVTLGANPFRNCESLNTILVSPTHPVLATIDGVLFHKGDRALISYPQGLPATEYTIPNGIRIIRESAFDVCSRLTHITLPDSVTTIERLAFYRCSQLSDITFSTSLTSIGEKAFKGCGKLTSLTFHEGLLTIGDEAFTDCKSLVSITLPDSLTSIGALAFKGCIRLTGVELPAGLACIGDEAFSSLHGATLNPANTALEIVGGALYSKADKRLHFCCDSAASQVTVQPGTLSIAPYAFYCCDHLHSISLPEGLCSIGKAAFYDCTGITAITLPSTCTDIGEFVFRGCSLTEITFPEGMTVLRGNTLRFCKHLTQVTLPSTLTTIEDYAFGGCPLTSLYLPASLTSISDSASFNKECRFTVEPGSYAEAYCQQKGFAYEYPMGSLDWLFD